LKKTIINKSDHRDIAEILLKVALNTIILTHNLYLIFSNLFIDAVPALVQLMYSDNEELQAVAASVLCNISQEDEVRVALTTSNAAEILIKRLMSPNEDIQSRSAIILSDIAYVDGNQSLISDKGGIEPLVELMDSEGHDVLVNAVNAVRVLCDGNEYNQTAISECGGIPPLVEFLTLINFGMFC